MTSFKGKVALVTGAGSGIGRGTAIMLAQRGARVILSDVNVENAEETGRMITEAIGADGAYDVIRCNVASEEDVVAMFGEIAERHGRLDIACNIAGVGGRKDGPMSALTTEAEVIDFDFIISINLRGAWLCMREELKMMSAQGSGSIVNLSSILGRVGKSGSAPYSASKHAILGLTKSIALEAAPMGVRVNAICPGVIATPLINALVGTQGPARDALTAEHPIGRLGTVEEVAEAVIFLASEQSSFMTGTELMLDGGYTAR